MHTQRLQQLAILEDIQSPALARHARLGRRSKVGRQARSDGVGLGGKRAAETVRRGCVGILSSAAAAAVSTVIAAATGPARVALALTPPSLHDRAAAAPSAVPSSSSAAARPSAARARRRVPPRGHRSIPREDWPVVPGAGAAPLRALATHWGPRRQRVDVRERERPPPPV